MPAVSYCFGTKHRIPHIHETWRRELHQYIAGTVKGLKGTPYEVGGVADHVHILVGLSSSHCLKDFMRDLKTAATIWVHEKKGVSAFAWQDGYAAFTVSASLQSKVKNYILRQEEHHKTKSFKEKLIEFLQYAEVDYDPKYLE